MPAAPVTLLYPLCPLLLLSHPFDLNSNGIPIAFSEWSTKHRTVSTQNYPHSKETFRSRVPSFCSYQRRQEILCNADRFRDICIRCRPRNTIHKVRQTKLQLLTNKFLMKQSSENKVERLTSDCFTDDFVERSILPNTFFVANRHS